VNGEIILSRGGNFSLQHISKAKQNKFEAVKCLSFNFNIFERKFAVKKSLISLGF